DDDAGRKLHPLAAQFLIDLRAQSRNAPRRNLQRCGELGIFGIEHVLDRVETCCLEFVFLTTTERSFEGAQLVKRAMRRSDVGVQTGNGAPHKLSGAIVIRPARKNEAREAWAI